MIEPSHISSRLCSGVDKKTAQALHAVGGRPNWWSKELEADKSGYSAEDKILKITRAHESMMHLGGREGAVKLLHEAKVKWKNMDLDCAFLLRRCDHCLAKTTQIFQSTLVLFDPKKIEVFFSKKLEVFSLKK